MSSQLLPKDLLAYALGYYVDCVDDLRTIRAVHPSFAQVAAATLRQCSALSYEGSNNAYVNDLVNADGGNESQISVGDTYAFPANCETTQVLSRLFRQRPTLVTLRALAMGGEWQTLSSVRLGFEVKFAKGGPDAALQPGSTLKLELNGEEEDSIGFLDEATLESGVIVGTVTGGAHPCEGDPKSVLVTVEADLSIGDPDGVLETLYEAELTSSPLYDALWARHQEKRVSEGVLFLDGALPNKLRESLTSEVEALARSSQHKPDYHPHSNRRVRDLVHPALFAYVEGLSVVHKKKMEEFNRRNGVDGNGNQPVTDCWGREQEASKYQWLPTMFDIDALGKCNINGYINNLVPRARHEGLYGALAGLFATALPMVESVCGYGRAIQQRLRVKGELIDYDDHWKPLPVEPLSLRNRSLQVITKIVDYEIRPGEPYTGVWHVEGMSHENIVATVLYVLERDEGLRGADLLFKRAFDRVEAEYIFSNVAQCRPDGLEGAISRGLLPLGRLATPQGRLIVFPNSHVHKVSELVNTSDAGEKHEEVQKRRIVVFFVVHPDRRIVSTHEVPPQQQEAGGDMSMEQAEEHRLELMKERKYHKQDWNVREIELCEH